jgi:hypothetical protein
MRDKELKEILFTPFIGGLLIGGIVLGTLYLILTSPKPTNEKPQDNLLIRIVQIGHCQFITSKSGEYFIHSPECTNTAHYK